MLGQQFDVGVAPVLSGRLHGDRNRLTDIGPVQIPEQRPGQLRGAGESPAEGVGQIVLLLSEEIEDGMNRPAMNRDGGHCPGQSVQSAGFRVSPWKRRVLMAGQARCEPALGITAGDAQRIADLLPGSALHPGPHDELVQAAVQISRQLACCRHRCQVPRRGRSRLRRMPASAELPGCQRHGEAAQRSRPGARVSQRTLAAPRHHPSGSG